MFSVPKPERVPPDATAVARRVAIRRHPCRRAARLDRPAPSPRAGRNGANTTEMNSARRCGVYTRERFSVFVKMDCGERWTRKSVLLCGPALQKFLCRRDADWLLQEKVTLHVADAIARHLRGEPAISVRPQGLRRRADNFLSRRQGRQDAFFAPGACHLHNDHQAVPIQRHLHVPGAISAQPEILHVPRSAAGPGPPTRDCRIDQVNLSAAEIVKWDSTPRVRALCCHDDSLFGISPPGCGPFLLARKTIPVTHTDHDLYESRCPGFPQLFPAQAIPAFLPSL